MATWYVDSTATGTAAGTSWANACLTMAAAIALSAAGDDFNVSNGHAETQGSALTLTFKGTLAAPNRIFSCDRTNSPAQAGDLLAGAKITTTGAFGLTVTGSFYMYGVTFNIGTGTTAANSVLANSVASIQVYENCAFAHKVTVAANAMSLTGTSVPAAFVFKNTTVSFAGSASSAIAPDSCVFEWINTPSALTFVNNQPTLAAIEFASGKRTSVFRARGCDFTGVASGKVLIAQNGVTPATGFVQLVDCKITAGALISTPSVPFFYIDQIAASTYQRSMYQGVLTTETTIIRSGGSPQSWKLVTTANNKGHLPFECPELLLYCAAGSPVTVNLNCITDLATDATALTNADIWMEAQVMDNAGNNLSDVYTTAPATQLTAGSTLTSGTTSGSWTTTGMTTPDARNATLTFTPQIAGYVRITVKVARASLSTLRVDFDPKV